METRVGLAASVWYDKYWDLTNEAAIPELEISSINNVFKGKN